MCFSMCYWCNFVKSWGLGMLDIVVEFAGGFGGFVMVVSVFDDTSVSRRFCTSP